jgi:tellurite resistance protein TerC
MVKTKAMMTYRLARRIIIGIFGVTVLFIGIALLVLPGPAFIVIPTGLGILGLEFTWARRWLAKFQEKANGVYHNFKRRRKPSV